MSKRCPDCGFVNEDARIYCGSCGELLDPELRLIHSLEKHTAAAPQAKPGEPRPPKPAPAPRRDGDDDYVPRKMAREKKSGVLPWVLLALGAAAVVIGVLILSYAV